MKKHLLSLLVVLSFPAMGRAGICVANQTGSMSDSAIWFTGNNSALPDNYTGTNVVAVSATPGYTNYYTPSNASDVSVGLLFYIFSVPATTATLTVNLSSGTAGTILLATATITLTQNTVATNGPNGGWFFAKWATPVTYGDVTANQWRGKFTSSGGTVNLRRNAASQAAYVEVLQTTRTITSNDNLYITGSGTTAGAISTCAVTVDISTTVGAVSVGAGGRLTFGESQTASNKLTVGGDLRVSSSYSSDFGFEMGKEMTPLTSSYVQEVSFASPAARYRLILGDEALTSYQYNNTPARISIRGNYLHNQASEAVYKSSVSANVAVSTNIITVTNDMGLLAGTTILITASAASGQDEIMYVSSYDSVLKQITVTTNTTYAHSTYTWVHNMSANAVISSTGSTYMAGVEGMGYYLTPATRIHVEVAQVSLPYIYEMVFNSADSTSYVKYARILRNNLAAKRGFGLNFGSVEDSIYQGIGIQHGGPNNTTFNRCTFVSSANLEYYLSGYLNSYHDCYFSSMRFTFSSTAQSNKFYNTTFCGGWTYNIWYGTLNSYKNEFHNCIEGVPVPALTAGVATTAAMNYDIFFNNMVFGSPTEFVDSALPNMTSGSMIKIQNYDNGNIGLNKIFKGEGIIQTSGAGLPLTTTRTAGKPSLAFLSYASHPYSVDDIFLETSMPIKSGQSIIWSGYINLDSNYAGVKPTLTLTSADSAISDSYTITVSTGSTWERFVLTGEATSDTYVTMKTNVPGTVGYAYLADQLATIGDPVAGNATSFEQQLWSEGIPSWTPLGGTVDSTYLQESVQAVIDASTPTWSGIYLTTTSIAAAVPTASTTTIAAGVWNYAIGQSTGTSGAAARWMYKGLPDKIKSDIR